MADIDQIFISYQKGLKNGINKMIMELKDENCKTSVLQKYLVYFNRNITILEEQYSFLISVLLKVNWTYRGDILLQEYKSFIVNLVLSHPINLSNVLSMVLSKFMIDGRKQNELTESMIIEDEQTFQAAHSILKAIIKMIPMTPTVLLPMIEKKFPYHTSDPYRIKCYAGNTFRVCEYLPQKRSNILCILIEQISVVDMECSRDAMRELEFQLDEDTTGKIFEMDGLVDNKLQNMSMRLDNLMMIMFSYIRSVCYLPNNELNWEATKVIYRELLTSFDKVIIRTHKSSHIQFMMFYICSFKEELQEGFIDYLWKKYQNPNTESVLKKSCVAYMASLMSRAKYFSVENIRVCLQLMVQWSHAYVNEMHLNTDSSSHSVFYSLMQAIFYVITFKHKSILASKNGTKFLESLKLNSLITCRLNPLAFCLPIISSSFASIMRCQQLLFCDTILERNRRVLNKTQDYAMDTLFPFDPYMLKQSNVFISNLYQEYIPNSTENHLQDDNSSDEEDMEIYNSPMSPLHSNNIEKYLNSENLSSSLDIMMYSSSPGFKSHAIS